jgi:hypothetical protein
MVAACYSEVGTGRLRFEGNMNGAKYREILDENLLQSAQDLTLALRFTFQQDNYPYHTAKTTQWWLREKSLNVLEWASQTPYLNTNKHFWRDLKIAVQRLPIQHGKAGEDLEREMGETPQKTGVPSL